MSFVVQTPQGAVNSLDAMVCGVFRKGAPWYDNAFYVTLAAAQALVDWPGGATNVKVLLEDGSPRALARARAGGRGGGRPGPAGAARDGDAASASRATPRPAASPGRSSRPTRRRSSCSPGFLFAAAGVGVVNAMLMSVHERTREIGTMRALGMRRSRVVRLFVLEGMALGFVSALAGALGGAAAVLYLAATGISMNVTSLAWMAGGDVLFPVARALEPAARRPVDRASLHARRHVPRVLRQPPRAPGGPAPCLVASASGSPSPSWRPRPPRPLPTPATILRRADRAVLGETAAYTLRMTVVRPGKAERVVEMKGWKKGDDRGLVRYTAPAKERGTAYLRSGDSTWLYLPAAEKVVRVGAKQNFGGGDFSNADIFRLSLVEDYDPTLAGEETVEGEACYKLELKAKDRSVAYDRVVYWVRSRRHASTR